MKKTYVKPMANIGTFSSESVISASVIPQNAPTNTVKYTKGRLNF